VSPLTTGIYYNSDPLVLPIGFINNNDYRVFWCSSVSEHLMNIRQAEYMLYNVPINAWSLTIMVRQGNIINSDSAWFFMGYF
jgi:hypothetical protein